MRPSLKPWISATIFALSLTTFAIEKHGPVRGGQTQRVSQQTNTIRDYGLIKYIRLSKDLPHRESQPWKLVCKLPYNCQFQPWIELDAKASATLDFNSTNPLVRYLTPTESRQIEPGTHRYEAEKWVSGEGAVYTIPANVTVKSVKYRETGFDTDITGGFSCNDEDYNILWRRAARTAYLCMRDHFYDCPDRERVGFWGDGTPELDQCFYIFDKRSHKLCKDLATRRLEPDFYPGQHLEFLGEYGLWFYYMQTGDLDSITKVYEPTKTFLLKTYKFGNKNTWFDWGKDVKDTSVIENCFMFINLQTLRKIAASTGHQSDFAEIDRRLAEIKSTFNNRFWKGSYYQSSDVNTPDDRANAMAINAGLAKPSKWESINETVLSKTTYSSCFFDRWVFEALCKIGKPDQAMLRMANRYRTMIDSKFSTLWEHYDRWWASWIDAFDEGSSLNHGWNPPAILLGKTVAGVRPVEPGWTTFEVLPQESFLTSLKVDVPTIRGHVRVQIQKTKKEYTLSLNVPANTKAVVGIPKVPFEKLDAVYANGKAVWRNNEPAGDQKIECIGDKDGFIQFKVGVGNWRFVAKGLLPLKSVKVPAHIQREEIPLDSRSWTATASVPDGSFGFTDQKIPIDVSANNALDGDYWTGWRDMTSLQHPGQWFQVDMKELRTFNKIVLDNTWALWDSPNRYTVTISSNGNAWSAPLAQGPGHLGITKITFPCQTARYIRVTQSGSDPKYHWSIYEFSVFNTEPN
jgi:hypothetical protein